MNETSAILSNVPRRSASRHALTAVSARPLTICIVPLRLLIPSHPQIPMHQSVGFQVTPCVVVVAPPRPSESGAPTETATPLSAHPAEHVHGPRRTNVRNSSHGFNVPGMTASAIFADCLKTVPIAADAVGAFMVSQTWACH